MTETDDPERDALTRTEALALVRIMHRWWEDHHVTREWCLGRDGVLADWLARADSLLELTDLPVCFRRAGRHLQPPDTD